MQHWVIQAAIWITSRDLSTVRLSFGKKYGTELRTVFSGKLRYGTKIRYYFFRPYRTLSVHKVLKTKSLVLTLQKLLH